MKYILKGLAILAFLFSQLQGFSQTNISNFTIDSDNITISGEQTSIASKIIKIEDTITWSQFINNEAANAMSFIVDSNVGTWDENATLGSITYTMHLESYQAQLLLLGEASGITATLTLMINESVEEVYIFNITSISYQ